MSNTYYVIWDGNSIADEPYSEAARFAKKKSVECGLATIICEEMQFFMKGIRKIPTRTWQEIWENGQRIERTPLMVRFSPHKGDYVSVEEWEEETIKDLKEHGLL